MVYITARGSVSVWTLEFPTWSLCLQWSIAVQIQGFRMQCVSMAYADIFGHTAKHDGYVQVNQVTVQVVCGDIYDICIITKILIFIVK